MSLLVAAPYIGALGLFLQPATPVPEPAGKAPEPPRLPLKAAQPVVEVIVPAAADKQTMVEADSLYSDKNRVQTSGNATIHLPSGVQIRVSQARLQIVPGATPGEQRILIIPLSEKGTDADSGRAGGLVGHLVARPDGGHVYVVTGSAGHDRRSVK